MNDNYILLRLNRKKYKIIELKEKQGIIEVDVCSRKKKVRCPNCNSFTSSIHDYLRPIRSTYLDSCTQKVILIIHKRRFHCYKCNKIFTEEIDLTDKNKNISNAVKIEIRKDLKKYNLTIDYIANKNHVSKYIVRNELEEATSTIPQYQKNLPRVISFDEFKADTKEGKYAFILNDPIHKKVLDVLSNRKKEYLLQYFTHTENRHSVEFVISDMYEPYLLVQQIMFPKAEYVVDKFHYIRYVMDALDNIRIKLQKQYGEKSREYKLLKNKKNVSLLRKYGNDINWWVETERYRNGRIIRILPSEVLNELKSISDELKRGYDLKELFLDIVNHANYEEVKVQLNNWIDLCKESKIEEFIEASKTIENWLEYICNSFIDSRYTNGFTEGTNNKIKVIKRNAFGYKNFNFLRKRILYIFNENIGGGINNRKNNNKTNKN